MNAGTDKLKPSTFNFNDYSINGSNINSPTLLDNTIQGNLDVNVVDIV
ncbi:MAG: hypothetical protein F6K34_06950 [Okeania sp. SIO4D6]|nr:hypothetical protein [Okeania sp. SIO4D6]